MKLIEQNIYWIYQPHLPTSSKVSVHEGFSPTKSTAKHTGRHVTEGLTLSGADKQESPRSPPSSALGHLQQAYKDCKTQPLAIQTENHKQNLHCSTAKYSKCKVKYQHISFTGGLPGTPSIQ